MQIYIAGSLFSESQVAGRLREGKIARERLGEYGVKIFNPIEQPYNEDKSSLPTPREIFENDLSAILNSNYVIFDMGDETDPGVAAELGIVGAINQIGVKLVPIGVYSDIRLNDSNKYDIPSYGVNHFTLGILEAHGHIVNSFEQALDIIENDLKIDKE